MILRLLLVGSLLVNQPFLVHATSVNPSSLSSFVAFNGTSSFYSKWKQNATSFYKNQIFYPSSNDPTVGAAIHWTIDRDEEEIHLAVAVKATGWAAFGISENGGMRGADVVLYTAKNNELEDAYLLNELARPIPDDCQHWKLVNSIKEDGMIIFEARRALDTGDSQDRSIAVDDSSRLVSPNRVIAAWGNAAKPTYHGPNNRVKGSIRFYKSESSGDEEDLFREAVNAEAEGSFIVKSNDHLVEPTDTFYGHVCIGSKDLEAQGVPMNVSLHTIGMEPVIDKGKYIHHYILYASLQDFDSSTQSCEEEFFRGGIAYVWGPGEGPLAFPSEAGGLLGQDGYLSFQLEIHYNNPWLDVGNIDNSGARIYYTSQKRQFDIGILRTGDPNIGLFGQVVGDGLSRHAFTCPNECSQISVSENVTVFREYLHMHQSGTRMFNSQIRSGQVIRQSNANFYDFEQQGALSVVQDPFQILPGDGFETTCYFNSQNGEKWGISSQDEMCMSFILYYPRQVVNNQFEYICAYGFSGFPSCSSSYERSLLTTTSELERSFGRSDGVATCMMDNNSLSTIAPAGPPQGGEPASSAFALYLESMMMIMTLGMMLIF